MSFVVDESAEINQKTTEGDNNAEDDKFETKAFQSISKKVTRFYEGVPRKVEIRGRVENLSCGDLNSFGIVKL